MELFYPILLTTFLAVIVFTTLAKSHKNQPPGPMKLPIIGNLHNMIGSLPHRSLWRLSQKYGPFMHLQLGELSTLVVSSADIAKEFMKTNDLSFTQRPMFLVNQIALEQFDGNMAFAPYGDYWRQMRKFCAIELLSSKRVQSYSSIREEEVQRLVESIKTSSSLGCPINLTEMTLEMASTIISRALFGRKYDVEFTEKLASNFMELIHLAGDFDIADLYPSMKIFQVLSPKLAKVKHLLKDIIVALQDIVDKHISEPRSDLGDSAEIEDLVDVLLRIQNSGSLAVPLTITSIKAILSDMFVGASDTSATTLDWAMAELMKNSRVMAKAQAEIRLAFNGKKVVKEEDIQGLSYMKMVIKEVLRLHPPGPLIPRECREPCVIGGFKIPMKTRVFFNLWAIGRDPKYWHDADNFYPERFMNTSIDFKGTNFEFIPFGAGRRMCPGMTFGLASVELALCQLLYHFNWNLPDQMNPEKLDMTEHFGAVVSRKFNLKLMAVPFISS